MDQVEHVAEARLNAERTHCVIIRGTEKETLVSLERKTYGQVISAFKYLSDGNVKVESILLHPGV